MAAATAWLAVGLVCVWVSVLFCRRSAALDPRTLIVLYTLSAYLCPIWLYEDPSLGSSSSEEGRAYARGLLALMAPVYLALVAAQLGRLPPAS